MGCGLWAVGCGLWAVGCGLWAVGCGLWAVGCGLWAVGLQDVKDLNSQGEIHQDKKLWKPKLG